MDSAWCFRSLAKSSRSREAGPSLSLSLSLTLYSSSLPNTSSTDRKPHSIPALQHPSTQHPASHPSSAQTPPKKAIQKKGYQRPLPRVDAGCPPGRPSTHRPLCAVTYLNLVTPAAPPPLYRAAPTTHHERTNAGSRPTCHGAAPARRSNKLPCCSCLLRRRTPDRERQRGGAENGAKAGARKAIVT